MLQNYITRCLDPTYVEDDVGVATVEFAVVFLRPVSYLEFLWK